VILLDATPKARELNDQVAARCPFCHAGHEAVVIMAEVGEYPPSPQYYVMCRACWARGPVAGWPERAVEGWNRSAERRAHD
jgi:hypothetical protein